MRASRPMIVEFAQTFIARAWNGAEHGGADGFVEAEGVAPPNIGAIVGRKRL